MSFMSSIIIHARLFVVKLPVVLSTTSYKKQTEKNVKNTQRNLRMADGRVKLRNVHFWRILYAVDVCEGLQSVSAVRRRRYKK